MFGTFCIVDSAWIVFFYWPVSSQWGLFWDMTLRLSNSMFRSPRMHRFEYCVGTSETVLKGVWVCSIARWWSVKEKAGVGLNWTRRASQPCKEASSALVRFANSLNMIAKLPLFTYCRLLFCVKFDTIPVPCFPPAIIQLWRVSHVLYLSIGQRWDTRSWKWIERLLAGSLKNVVLRWCYCVLWESEYCPLKL